MILGQISTDGRGGDSIWNYLSNRTEVVGIICPLHRIHPIRENLKGAKVRVIGVEPASCPTLTKGLYAYDFGDTGLDMKTFPSNSSVKS